MEFPADYSLFRKRRSPSTGVFFAPPDLQNFALIHTLACLCKDIASFSVEAITFQQRNCRSLVRKMRIFFSLFEYLRDFPFPLPSSANICLKELYILIYRSKMLLDYCSQSSRLWLLLQNPSMSGYFHDLDQDLSTLLDVFPKNELNLSKDVEELVELLQKQSSRASLFIDQTDESLRQELLFFLDEFERGRIPSTKALQSAFVEKLRIQDQKSCREEIEHLEEQLLNREEDTEPALPVLNGFIALVRYCRFLLFDFNDEDEELTRSDNWCNNRNNQQNGDLIHPIPRDFCCPISLEIMKDPVTVSTGQTYDRSSIIRWIEGGHSTCPKTGQPLSHTRLITNRALRALISQWCASRDIPFDPLESEDLAAETMTAPAITKASIEANRATVSLLVHKLSKGSQNEKAISAREIRLMAKTGRENRSYIAQAGAIPLLKKLLYSSNPAAQENAVTALLNLSLLDTNKSQILEEDGCLECIVQVLKQGWTEAARENAAATLFSLSAIHEHKKKIANQAGAIEALAQLLVEGSSRGKKDAVTALFNLTTHSESCTRMVETGAVSALVGALWAEEVAEEAAGSLALLVRQPAGARAVGREEHAVTGLIWVMRHASSRGKENAVAALLELCRTVGSPVTEKVVRDPAVAGLLQSLLFTGTKRARRKAASLARVCQRCEAAMDGWNQTEHADRISRNPLPFRRRTTAGDVSVSVSISVPVL